MGWFWPLVRGARSWGLYQERGTHPIRNLLTTGCEPVLGSSGSDATEEVEERDHPAGCYPAGWFGWGRYTAASEVESVLEEL